MPRGLLRNSERDAIFREATDGGGGPGDTSAWPNHMPETHQHKRNVEDDDSDQITIEHFSSVQTKKRLLILPHWDPEQVVDIVNDHAQDMGYGQRTASPQVTPGLVDMAKQGGFTLHDHVGDAPTNGYMVSQHKDTEQKMPIAGLRPEHIASYVNNHSRELSQPNNYLGGWLDGKDFYLDVSTHRPSIDRASADAVRAHQLAIYDLNKGQAINTPDAVWQSGDPGLATQQPMRNPFTGHKLAWLDEMPDHDWTVHDLGDSEHWANERTAAAGEQPTSFDVSQFKDTGNELGSHHAHVYQHPTTKEKWLVKPAPKSAPFLADLDVAANHVASQSGVDTPATFKTTHGSQPASSQYMYPGSKSAFPNGFDPSQVSPEDLLTIQKHHALDWMMGNHDSHIGQFIRDQSGKLIGIDKGQAFKYANNDRLGWDYHPNAAYGENEPVYNTLYREFAKGNTGPINDPRQGEYAKYIQGLQAIPDDEYRQTLLPYAQGAAKAGQLGLDSQQFPGNGPAKFAPNDVNAFLDHAVARKNSLQNDLGDLYDRAYSHRLTGEKIAKKMRYISMAAPDPMLLKNMHEQLGSHGASVFADPQGKWLVKKPMPGAEFMTPLDHATANLQERTGLTSPETHILPWKHDAQVTAIKMIPGASQAFMEPPHLKDLSPEDLTTIQKHQAMDWLIGNHDGHVGNWMRTPGNPLHPQGELVGIDKGQAFKYYGRDRLDPTFHPNFYAREPVYNQLWREHAEGQGQMSDPRTGEVGKYVERLQHMPDDDLKNMFRDYAEQASERGLLNNVQDDDPRRKLGPATLPPNDPEAFLNALAQRKNHLAEDLGKLYDTQSANRPVSMGAGV